MRPPPGFRLVTVAASSAGKDAGGSGTGQEPPGPKCEVGGKGAAAGANWAGGGAGKWSVAGSSSRPRVSRPPLEEGVSRCRLCTL